MTQYFRGQHQWPTDLFRSGARMVGLITDFEIHIPSHIQIFGYINLRHKGTVDGPIGLSARIGYRHDVNLAAFDDRSRYPTGTLPGSWNTQGFKWIPGAKDGANIRDLRHHYGTLMLMGDIIFSDAGAYRIEPYIFEHSAIAPDADGLACVNTDTNQQPGDEFGFMSTIVTPT